MLSKLKAVLEKVPAQTRLPELSVVEFEFTASRAEGAPLKVTLVARANGNEAINNASTIRGCFFTDT